MNSFKKLSIKTQMCIIAVTTIIVVFSIIFTMFTKFSNIVSNKNNLYTQQMIYQIKNTVSDNCDVLNRIVLNIKYNKIVQDYILETEPLEKFELYKNVKNFISNIKEMKDGIIDVVIIDNYNNIVEFNGGSVFANKVLHRTDVNEIYYSGVETYIYGQKKMKCFVIASEIFLTTPNTIQKTGENIGKVMIVTKTDSVLGELGDKSQKNSTRLYAVDRNNNVFSTNSTEEYGVELDAIKKYLTLDNKISKIEIGKKKYFLNVEELPEIRGKAVSIVPQKELFYDIEYLRRMEIITLIIAILALSFPFTIIINNILNPIKKFMVWISSVKSGNLNNLKVRVNVQGYSEIAVMSKEFNNMMDEIDSLAHRLVETNSRLYEMELDKKYTELAYLRSQINPHFLYNTFESIKGIAIQKDVPQIVDMTKALGKVFKYSVKGANMVTLSEEISIIQSYISIQLIRFDGRFRVAYNINPDTLKYMVPKMILQPIVENSIYHGLELSTQKGLLTIETCIDDNDDLIIEIKDNGIGMDENTKASILNSLRNNSISNTNSGEKSSIGLINVHNRIKLIYGYDYGISLKSEHQKGTQIFIKIPSGG